MSDAAEPKRVFIKLASDDRVITVGENDAALIFRADGTELAYIPPDDAHDPDDPECALQSMVKAQIAILVLSNEKLCQEILTQAGFELPEDEDEDEEDFIAKCDDPLCDCLGDTCLGDPDEDEDGSTDGGP